MEARERILVVDDDPDLRDMCALVLQKEGYQVRVADGAATALQMMREEPPELVILDVMMEEADSGFRMAEVVAREYPTVPVLMLSSIADAAARTFDTSQLPVAELANKPMSPAVLSKTVERLLSRARQRSGQ